MPGSSSGSHTHLDKMTMLRRRGRNVRGRLVRWERVSEWTSTAHVTAWDVIVRDSLLHIAWPMSLGAEPIGPPLEHLYVPGSSSNDLISRRGVFSRRHYGSVELLPQLEASGQDPSGRRFRIETGDSLGEKEEIFGSPCTPVLENPEFQTRWYFKYFLGKLHQNYVGSDADKIPFFLSVVLTDTNHQCVPQYRAILWRKTGAQKILLPHTPNKSMTVKQILSNFPLMDKIEKGPKEIFSPEIQKDLLLLEEQEGSVNFKFGVLYAKPNQSTDDEMLSNENGSEEFNQFISLLGNRVRLKSWDKYRGGLDVKGDMTGEYSTYTIYEGHEIMFHVSTMLPYSKDNRQQVERKRHIGNDIVNIVYLDGGISQMSQFNPAFIKSQFTHVFALVAYDFVEKFYKLILYSEESVPLFGPSLPCPPIFKEPQEFREFLIVKMINGEKATFNTPTFAKKRERTLDMLIKDLYSDYMSDSSKGAMLNRRAFSDVLPDPPRSSRRKEEARQVEFVRIGQALKLDTIVKGDAPTSLATTGLFKRAPWEPQCFYPDFGYDIACGDSWGDSRLVICAESGGVYIIEDSVSQRQIFDKVIQANQLNVIEAHGILLFRAEKGRDSKIYVFRLSEFEMGTQKEIKNKIDLKDHKLEKTRGCSMYAISKSGGSRLKMVVCVNRKLTLMQWKHSAAWTAWCPASDTDTVEGFVHLREFQIAEQPSIITLIESTVNTETCSICVGYKHQFDIIQDGACTAQRLFAVQEGSKAHLVAATDLYEDEEPELLLCYNNICHFQKLSEMNNSTEFDFHWNSIPKDIVCSFPYIIAFTTDTMEIRLIINGNLVQTMAMPKLKLICSKNDIFFATTAPEFFHGKMERLQMDQQKADRESMSPPSSPHLSPETKPLRLYRIPLHALSGLIGPYDRKCPNDNTDDQNENRAVGSIIQSENKRTSSRSCTASPTIGLNMQNHKS
ncbi:GTPase-activating Rap/Ran-GAP domain-like protein 3 isoform X2 [Daktulosphaira vitifoliae]|uniref:GTPase-activating Rap/Ran-GAP domain-like protein 3 isoform X2 n=1 Tax=Daktulosphaira vitifoliae TaxID=58002 RepID=UPI0021AACA68|nr:GTPase-activating Rap/Ran-GAP domain-like protein 3 isoform X2 [Daktulosphaira vitifoliae]XP_050528755.1 GTPase-activating Rap/Ran-GAP domain-like protein 3 isoform X2 [Daktulosphaira vitifoliae]